jgi:tetratricopeptide (TPR) repeat protein
MTTGTPSFPKELTGNLSEVAHGYQQMLAGNPCHPQALVGMTLVALASRQSAAAVKMAEAATAAAPLMPETWIALGQALTATGRASEAELAYRRALHLDGLSPLARMGLGELMLANDRPLDAISEFELALRQQPALAGALIGLGNVLASLGRNEEALTRYDEAISARPRLPEAEFAAGYVLAALGRVKEAETRYRRALAYRPDFAAAWMNLGSLLRDDGRDVFAEAALRRAVELRPDLISGWVNLAMLERDRRHPDQAEAYLRKAFALNPCQVETLIAWCQFRAAEADLPGAWRWLDWSLARNPNHPEAVNMHGILLHKEARFDEAIAIFEQAELLGSRAAASNRGNSLMDLGRLDDSLRAQELAVALDPQSAGAAYNLSLTRLRAGDWLRGWPGYESRWRFREIHRAPRTFAEPRWQGEALNGCRILLHAEQGLGDTIQFCRYASLVAARGGVPILQVQPAVERLMASLAGPFEVVQLNAATQPKFDLECPLMSLPAIFQTTVESVPWSGPYLAADPELVRQKRLQFTGKSTGAPSLPRTLRKGCDDSQNLGPGAPSIPRTLRKRWDEPQNLCVGIAWAGNPRYKADRQRSVHLSTLLPLLRAPGVAWVALQKGPAAEQLAALPGDVQVQDGSSHDQDLAETAALIASLDLVITTDTCIAHLAGAMAKPVWILLPHLSDWRWMQQIETTPWYPTARLFRQPAPGDWPAVVRRVLAELSEFSTPQKRFPLVAAGKSPELSQGNRISNCGMILF